MANVINEQQLRREHHIMDDLAPAAVSVPEAARYLGISRESAYRAARSGELPAVRIGGRIVVPLDGLRALLGQSKDPATEEAGPYSTARVGRERGKANAG
jgi:excisionase family DNA binding protein